MSSFDPALCFVIAGALAAGVAMPWMWDCYRDRARRRAASRGEAASLAHSAKADLWWRQNSVSTMPQSRMFESSFQEHGTSVSRPSQHL